MKSNFLLLTLFALFTATISSAQLQINSNGQVTVTTNTPVNHSAFRVSTPNQNSYAYNLLYNGSSKFFVHGSGYLWCKLGGYFGSDLSLKEDINEISSPLSKLQKLTGYEYNYKSDEDAKENLEKSGTHSNGKRLGLIAQDVEKVFPGIVKTMPDKSKAISYTDLTAVLIEAIKEQQVHIDKLEQKINRSNNLTSVENIDSKSTLEQNAPNPFSESTTIKVFIIDNYNSASLNIYNMNGKQMKSFNLRKKGANSVRIDGNELYPGMFYYSLIIDGKEVDTKKMILTK